MPKKKQSKLIFTPKHALQILEAHNLDMEDEEEDELLEENNPELAEAYRALKEFANNG